MEATTTPIETQPQSAKIMTSYGFGKFAAEFFTLAFTTYCFFYYETEIGLGTWWTAAGYIIYAIWNSINDPLIGYLTNRKMLFNGKWGKRFPFIIIGALPWSFTFILIFTPPNVDPVSGGWILFLWLTIWSCMFDFLYSIWDVNYQAIFPDKFRGENERRKAAGIGTIVGVFGIALGSILPPSIIEEGVRSSYTLQAVVCAIIGLFAVTLMIPGVKETPEMIAREQRAFEQHKSEPEESFWSLLKFALKQRNVLAFLMIYFLYQSLSQSMTGSIAYFVQFILGRPQKDVTLIMAGFLVGALVSIPLWIKVGHIVKNNHKMILIGAIILTLTTMPLIWLEDYIGLIINMVIWGMGLGLFWAMTGPVFADAIDEVVVKTGKRNEGVYMGFRAFFGRLAFLMQALSFAIVHTLTGFVEGASTQSELAQWGIHVHMALLPMIFMILGGVIFWKLNDLTPAKSKQIREELIKLNL